MSLSNSGIDPLSIPQEIWSRVFSLYLPLSDRKNVRLTCHRFYDACSTCQIHQKEEMVFEGMFSTRQAIPSLCDVGRQIWNIKLVNVDLMDDFVDPFFEKHGANIHSLILINCPFEKRLLRAILEPCKNLKNFALIYKIKMTSDYNLRETVMPEFEALLKRDVVFPDVTDLTLELLSKRCRVITNQQLLHIFAIFPNVKKLHFTISLLDHEIDDSSSFSADATSNEVFSTACIYYHLQRVCHQLEELSLNIWQVSRQRFLAYETIEKVSSLEMTNLKRLSTNCNIIQPVVRCLSYQHLTSLECVISHNEEMPISAKVLAILKSSPKLDSLTVKVPDANDSVFMMSKECSVALIQSQLRTLNIWREKGYFVCPRSSLVWLESDACSFDSSVTPNLTLKHSSVHTEDAEVILFFSRYFWCLEDMSVKSAREDILQNIFNYQMKLRSLELLHCERYPMSRMRPKDNPFKRRLKEIDSSSRSSFDELNYLRIMDNISLDLSEYMLKKFVFPKLRHFTIHMEDAYPKMSCNIDKVWLMIQKLSSLEYLVIRWRTMVNFDQWLDLFNALPKLRHFSCIDSCGTFFSDSDYRLLFKNRPSLRCVYHHLRKKSDSIEYVYDILTSSIKTIPGGRDPRVLLFNNPIGPLNIFENP